MTFNGLNFSKLANGLIFYDLKGINSRVIYMYITILVKTVYLFISQVSGERLQDHWSSGLQLGLCLTWSEPKLLVFPRGGSFLAHQKSGSVCCPSSVHQPF